MIAENHPGTQTRVNKSVIKGVSNVVAKLLTRIFQLLGLTRLATTNWLPILSATNRGGCSSTCLFNPPTSLVSYPLLEAPTKFQLGPAR
jgi:hypothetical protein